MSILRLEVAVGAATIDVVCLMQVSQWRATKRHRRASYRGHAEGDGLAVRHPVARDPSLLKQKVFYCKDQRVSPGTQRARQHHQRCCSIYSSSAAGFCATGLYTPSISPQRPVQITPLPCQLLHQQLQLLRLLRHVHCQATISSTTVPAGHEPNGHLHLTRNTFSEYSARRLTARSSVIVRHFQSMGRASP